MLNKEFRENIYSYAVSNMKELVKLTGLSKKENEFVIELVKGGKLDTYTLSLTLSKIKSVNTNNWLKTAIKFSKEIWLNCDR